MIDLVSQKEAYINQSGVSRGVGTCEFGSKQVLASTFSNNDHGMFAQRDPVAESFKEAA